VPTKSSRKRGPTLEEIRHWPATVDVADGGRAYGLCRASAYQAIADGVFPAKVIRVNGRLRVVTSSLIATLEGSGSQAKSA
jgi:hypothetical protein